MIKLEYKGLSEFAGQGWGEYIKNIPERIIRVCPLCGNDESTVLFKIAIFPVVKCSICQFIYNREILESHLLQNIHYTWYTKSTIRKYYDIDDRLISNKEKYYSLFFDEIKKITGLSKGNYLDIGANFGISVKVARDKGWKAVGVEMDKNYCIFAREKFGIDLINKKIEEVLFQEEFDLIHMSHLLEHVVKPFELLKYLYNILGRKGAIFVRVPNMGSFSVNCLKERHRFFIPTHINHFTPISLINMIRRAGPFKIAFKRTRSLFPFTTLFANYNMTLTGKYSGFRKIPLHLKLLSGLFDLLFNYLNKSGFFPSSGNLLELLIIKGDD